MRSRNNPFMLFTTIIGGKVVLKIVAAVQDHCSRGHTGLGFCKLGPQHFHQAIHMWSHFACVSVERFIPNYDQFKIECWFVLTLAPAHSTHMKKSLQNIHVLRGCTTAYCSLEHQMALSLVLWPFWTAKVINKKHRDAINMAPNRHKENCNYMLWTEAE